LQQTFETCRIEIINKKTGCKVEGSALNKSNKRQQRPDTRQRILDAAERLFADVGLDVTFRVLADAADVNLAAIHYHFGSKEQLLAELFVERTKPIVEGRLRELEQLPRDSQGRATVEAILNAFFVPAIETQSAGSQGEALLRLRARLAFESNEAQNLVSEVFDASNHLFIEEFSRALPDLPKEEIYWRFHFLLGAVHFTRANYKRIQRFSNGLVDAQDPDQIIPRLVTFFAAGFKQPSE
jgi:AcrR family transcriptional regulator